MEDGVEKIGGRGSYYLDVLSWPGTFAGCSSLQTVEIPDSVRQIGVKAFQNCTNLKQIKLSIGMRYIDDNTFEGCTSLEQITLPKQIGIICQKAFYGCSALENISIPESLSEIRAYALSGTKWLADRQAENPLVIVNGILISNGTASGNVKIPENVVEIAPTAFCGNQKIIEVEIPGNVNEIGTAAFERCSNLKSVKLAEGIESISQNAFFACDSLMEIEIPKGVAVLGDGAFSRCKSLKSAKISGSIKSLGCAGGWLANGVFENCPNLEYVSISEGPIEISSLVFWGCERLAHVEIPSSVTHISESAFKKCEKLTIWGQTGSFAQTYAAENGVPFRILGSNRGTVQFDANGGAKISFDSLEVVENATYGTLPDATRKGYLFQGWYTAATGGTRITEQSVVTFPWEPVLYARWSKISLKRVALQKPTNPRSQKMKLCWKKIAHADGYQVIYATNQKLRKPKTKTTASKTLTIKKLKKGKTYYVKVRAYKLDSAGKKVFGAYSKARKVTIQK